MFAVRALQAWSLFLIVCLVIGLAMMTVSRDDIVAASIGLTVNLFLQFGIWSSIRKRKKTLLVGQAPRCTSPVLATGFLFVVSALTVALGTDTALFVSHIFSARSFALFAIGSAVLAAFRLTRSFSRQRNFQR